jgi:hypothetical protein
MIQQAIWQYFFPLTLVVIGSTAFMTVSLILFHIAEAIEKYVRTHHA